MSYLMILISSALVSNVVLSRFLGICPFLGVSSSVKTAKGMGLAVVFVVFISTLSTFLINRYLLEVSGIFGIDLTTVSMFLNSSPVKPKVYSLDN